MVFSVLSHRKIILKILKDQDLIKLIISYCYIRTALCETGIIFYCKYVVVKNTMTVSMV